MPRFRTNLPRMHPQSRKSFSELFQLGLTAAQTRNLTEASALFGRAIELQPDHAAAHGNRGTVLMELKQWDEALLSFDKAIALKADYAVAYCNRGNVLRQLKRWEGALASYDRAISIKPDFAECFCNRGNVLRELNQLHAALASCNHAIAINPALADAYLNRGIVHRELGQLDAALSSYDQAIALRANYAEAFCNRGVVLQELGQLEVARVSYDRAIAIKPDFAEAHFNRSMALLASGDLVNGWIEYEWRSQLEGMRKHDLRNHPQPRWLGVESLVGKTLLLHGEQGLGDTLQFCRYAKLAAERGAEVILEVPRSLASLLVNLEGVAQVVVTGDSLPAFDYYSSLMSLPLAFKTAVANVPAQVPYIRSCAKKSRCWQELLGATIKRRVGLVWSGGFRPDQPEVWSVNSRRNIPLLKFASLRHPDIEFYSLQKGQPVESELADVVAGKWDGPDVLDFTHLLNDFSDTAALVDQMDLVIAVDTSTAHLAGALGKPVWLLNRFDSCWRWLLDRTYSPWYPTLRLYRQESPGDWDGVIEKVRRDLIHAVSGPLGDFGGRS
jgi:tetratricopeptide (TPR) repeat protein